MKLELELLLLKNNQIFVIYLKDFILEKIYFFLKNIIIIKLVVLKVQVKKLLLIQKIV